MERESTSKTIWKLVPIAVLICAFALRFIGLGAASLTMNEAENALTAVNLFTAGSNGQFLYVLPTSLLFKAFGVSEFSARLFPALMGLLLAVIPLLCTKKFGFSKACALSFLFAVDPVLLFWSKRADAVMPSITLGALVFLFILNGKKSAAFTAFLLLLTGGERSWPVVIILVLCTAAALLRSKIDVDLFKISRRDFFLSIFFFVLFCTVLGLFPGGFNGLGTGFANSFQKGPDWVYPGLSAMLVAVFLYCSVPLLLCCAESFRQNRIPLLLAVLFSGAVLLFWHGIVMLPWVMVFLWYFASDVFVKILKRLEGPVDFPFFMVSCILSGAYSFFYFRLVELFKQANGNEPLQITWNGAVQTLPLTRFSGMVLLTLVSIVIIALIVKILLGFVESVSVRRGMICGCLIVLSWCGVTGVWNAGGFDRIGDHPASPHLRNTANLLNGSYTSFTDSAFFALLDETVAKHGDSVNTNYGLCFVQQDPMMEWQLKRYPGIKSAANYQTDLTGVDLLIDDSGFSFELKGYVGMQHNWRGTMDWSRFSFQDWGKWLIFGDGSMVNDKPLTLWVRADHVYSFTASE